MGSTLSVRDRFKKKVSGKVHRQAAYYSNSKDGPVGKTKIDRKNPDPTMRNRPILGLQVVKGLIAKGDNRWGNGTCYNPENGKSY